MEFHDPIDEDHRYEPVRHDKSSKKHSKGQKSVEGGQYSREARIQADLDEISRLQEEITSDRQSTQQGRKPEDRDDRRRDQSEKKFAYRGDLRRTEDEPIRRKDWEKSFPASTHHDKDSKKKGKKDKKQKKSKHRDDSDSDFEAQAGFLSKQQKKQMRKSKDEGKDRQKKEKMGIMTFDSSDDEESHRMPGGYS